ncbi:hypothetical protein BJ165DRAFT_1417406 [Panaeolus papilionaceus]|nr:hypothetical protein BJ165DRAFT_1417406 [Panaeolus papilionaceus]
MEETRGAGRGSYIFGWFVVVSVHNIRIERLWVDVTNGVSRKWKDFFKDLELTAGLQPDLSAHIWLLHVLFLNSINNDLTGWKDGWNNHKIPIPGVGTRSPADLQWFSMIEQGLHGFRGQEASHLDVSLNAEEIEEYGIDWHDLENPLLLNHHLLTNPADIPENNPFQNHRPASFSIVTVEEERCPFTDRQLEEFMRQFLSIPENICNSFHMEDRKVLWILTLDICASI